MISNDEVKKIQECHSEMETLLNGYLEKLTNMPGMDHRCVALAKTKSQECFMWLRAGTQHQNQD